MNADYPEDALDRSLVSPKDRFGERFRKNATVESIQWQVVEHEIHALTQTLRDLVTSGSIPRAAALLLGARRRYISGEGKSAAYAHLLNVDLSATLSNVFLVDGRGLSMVTVLSDVRASDVLVVFSMRRYREETIRLGRLFIEAGGQLIVITDREDSPLVSIATVTIRVNTGSVSYADSPTSVASVCHLLSTLTAASAKGARRRLTAREHYSADLGLYVPDNDENGHQ